MKNSATKLLLQSATSFVIAMVTIFSGSILAQASVLHQITVDQGSTTVSFLDSGSIEFSDTTSGVVRTLLTPGVYPACYPACNERNDFSADRDLPPIAINTNGTIVYFSSWGYLVTLRESGIIQILKAPPKNPYTRTYLTQLIGGAIVFVRNGDVQFYRESARGLKFVKQTHRGDGPLSLVAIDGDNLYIRSYGEYGAAIFLMNENTGATGLTGFTQNYGIKFYPENNLLHSMGMKRGGRYIIAAIDTKTGKLVGELEQDVTETAIFDRIGGYGGVRAGRSLGDSAVYPLDEDPTRGILLSRDLSHWEEIDYPQQ